MKVEIHAPDVNVFLISLIIALLALVCYVFVIPYITPVAHWIALLAYAVLAFACTIKT